MTHTVGITVRPLHEHLTFRRIGGESNRLTLFAQIDVGICYTARVGILYGKRANLKLRHKDGTDGHTVAHVAATACGYVVAVSDTTVEVAPRLTVIVVGIAGQFGLKRAAPVAGAARS